MPDARESKNTRADKIRTLRYIRDNSLQTTSMGRWPPGDGTLVSQADPDAILASGTVPGQPLQGGAGHQPPEPPPWALDAEEARRLDALDRYEAVGTPPEPEFDRIVRLAAGMFDAEVAVLGLVDEHQVWLKARCGTMLDRQPRGGSFCGQVVLSSAACVVMDPQSHPGLAAEREPLGRALAFCAGVPVTGPEGERVGALCIMDSAARDAFSAVDAAALVDLAAIASQQLEHRRQTLALERMNQRTARTDTLLHAVAEAATCDQALASVLTRLCDDHGAAAGSIWTLARPDNVLRAVSRSPRGRTPASSHFERLQPSGMRPGNSIIAEAALSGTPRAVRFAGVSDLRRYPMVKAAMENGLRSLVIQPLRVSGERFAVTLAFDRDRSDLDLVLADVGSLVDTIRPVLHRKLAEEQAYLLSTALDRANDAVVITEPQPEQLGGPRIVYANASFCRATGRAAHEVVGQPARVLLPGDAEADTQRRFDEALRGAAPARTELELCRKDGTRYWVETDVTPIADPGGGHSHWISIQRDVTGRRRADQARKEREASNRTLFEQSPMPTLLFDRDSLRFLDANGAAVRQYGWSRQQFLQMSLHDVQAPDEQPAFRNLIAAEQTLEIAGRPWTHFRADGSSIQVMVASHALTYAGEDAIMAVLQDVTEVEAARRAMQDANLRLADLASQLQARTSELTEAHRLARLGTWRRMTGAAASVWSDEMHEIIGVPKSAGPPNYEVFLDRVHPEDQGPVRAMQDAAAAQLTPGQVDFRVLLPGGGVRHCRLDARPILDADGAMRGLYGYCQDITAHKQTELALLRSEKLKSIGQLTGGIAHDFNNLLTVVTLNLEEALESLAPDEPLQDILQPAMHAALRGADLTQQLLSYARRAALRPEQVRLSTFFRNLQPLLTRTIGKAYDLQLRLHHDGLAYVDPAQLENAIINLVINARDATPNGGVIQVSTALATVAPPGMLAKSVLKAGLDTDVPEELAPGRHLVVRVADSGTGIPPDVLARVFEPFFTTKDVGRGSGLGLSMVYGFAKQSGGLATIASEPGAGTTVRLFLPLVQPAGGAQPAPAPSWRQQGLRVLVVDDEPELLSAAARMMSGMGLEVTVAPTAEQAAAMLHGPGRFDLLFSDVRLPGPVDGLKLAEQARAKGVGVLLTSGYTDHSAAALEAAGGQAPGDAGFLAKPYTRQALQAALAAALGPASP